METETNGVDPKSRSFWLLKAREMYGPGVEVARVSSADRNSRFVVCLGSIRLGGRRDFSPIILGAGDSYEAAISDSEKTEPGKIAAQQWKEFVAEKMAEIEKANKENDDLSKSAAADAREPADDSSGGNDPEGSGSQDF